MSITFVGTGSVLATAALAAAALALAAWLYRRILTVPRGRWLLALRLAAISALVLLMARPVVSWEHARIEDGRIVVLVDASRSMSVRDAMDGVSRLDAARAAVGELLPRLERIAPVELSAFDATGRRMEDLSGLRAEGEWTDPAKALRAALEGHGKVIAAVMLTDGQETGAESLADAARVPVHAVAIGSALEGRDGAVARVEVDREAFIHTKVAARVDLRTTGYDATPGVVELRRGDEVIARQELTLSPGRSEALLAFTPAESGVFEYEVRLEPLPGEKVIENNSRWFALRVSAEKIRVLYYEGTPRWEYRYARRALSKDANVKFTGLVRTNVDKVYQQGSAELRAFPDSLDALKPYHAIVLGDVGREDLTQVQAALLRKYVEEGGGLLVAGGRKLFGADGLRGSAIEGVLPLAIGSSREVTGTLGVEVAREGVSHPAFLGLSQFLAITNVFATGGAKPGAQVLALAGGEPLLTAQRFGSGRVMLLSSDTDWMWCTSGRERGGEALFERMWGQCVRWLASRESASASSSGARISTDQDVYSPGQTVRIKVEGIEAANVVVEGQAEKAEVSLDRGEGSFDPRAGGIYRVSCGGLHAEFAVERSTREMDRIAVNEEILRRAAAASGGAYYTQASAKDLPGAISRATVSQRTRGEWNVENSPWFFLLFVLLIGADWAVRRWMQLA